MPCSFTTAPPLSEGGHLRRNVVSFGEIERGGLILVVLGEIDRPMCRWVMPVGVRSGGKITGNGCVPDPPPSAPLADLTAYLSAHICLVTLRALCTHFGGQRRQNGSIC